MEHWIEQYHQIGQNMTWFIVVSVCSKAKLQFDRVQKKEDPTHKSN
jgi:hypothetical protein